MSSILPRLIQPHYQGRTVKLAALVADPPAFATVIGPEVAPVGTIATNVVVDFTVKLAAAPLKLTLVVPTKWPPEMVTFCPTEPVAGENLEIAGFGFGNPLSICTTVPPPS